MNDAAGQKVPESYKKKKVMDMLGVLLHKKKKINKKKRSVVECVSFGNKKNVDVAVIRREIRHLNLWSTILGKFNLPW